LARLLARRADGIHLAPFEQGEIGPELFRAACSMMLEGLGIETSRQPLPSWPVAGLDQGQEPEVGRDESRQGRFLLAVRFERLPKYGGEKSPARGDACCGPGLSPNRAGHRMRRHGSLKAGNAALMLAFGFSGQDSQTSGSFPHLSD
jgi:hypothetical protein